VIQGQLKSLNQNVTYRRIAAVTQDQAEFIWNAVEAKWTTPKIAAEMPDLTFAAVFLLAREARRELRERDA
jgi:hypothetical protein